MTGEWLAHCQACSVPEFASVLNRAGVRYDIITGYLSEDYVWEEIASWVDAVRVMYGCAQAVWEFWGITIVVC